MKKNHGLAFANAFKTELTLAYLQAAGRRLNRCVVRSPAHQMNGILHGKRITSCERLLWSRMQRVSHRLATQGGSWFQ